MILAIKGHTTRGEEVIKILEMLGGKSNGNMRGYNDDLYYFIATDGLIYGSGIEWEDLVNNFLVFTLEEFENKYPYKVGDKVTLDNKLCTIMWMCWECDKMYYQVQETNGMFTKKVAVDELKPYKEEKTVPPYMDYDIKATKEQETMEEINIAVSALRELAQEE